MAMGVAADSPKPPRPPGHSDVVGIGISQRASVPVHAGSPPVAKLLQPCLGRLSAGHTDAHHECLDIGSHTLAGTRYSGLNQDYMVVQELYTSQEIPRGGQQTYVVAICDGHGILGDKSACFAGKALARHVYMSQLRNKHLARLHGHEVEDEMKVAFKKAHHAANLVYDMPPKHVDYPNTVGASKLTTYTLVDQEGIKSYRSGKGSEKMLECGTTCTAAIIQGRCVCLANVGDSLAVVGRERQGTVSCETVTVRHHGLLESERQRIIDNHSATTEVLPDGYIKVCVGPWAGYELAVTRALGHKNMEPLGVLDDPHCVMLDMDPASACCLILASDGLWDVMNGDEAVAYVMDGRRKGQTAAAVAHGLVELAVQRGLDTLEEQDNTSAIVVFFRHLE